MVEIYRIGCHCCGVTFLIFNRKTIFEYSLILLSLLQLLIKASKVPYFYFLSSLILHVFHAKYILSVIAKSNSLYKAVSILVVKKGLLHILTGV